MPLNIPAIARNQAAKKAGARPARSPGTEAIQIAIHDRLKTRKAENDIAGRPSRAGSRS